MAQSMTIWSQAIHSHSPTLGSCSPCLKGQCRVNNRQQRGFGWSQYVSSAVRKHVQGGSCLQTSPTRLTVQCWASAAALGGYSGEKRWSVGVSCTVCTSSKDEDDSFAEQRFAERTNITARSGWQVWESSQELSDVQDLDRTLAPCKICWSILVGWWQENTGCTCSADKQRMFFSQTGSW